MMTRNLVSALLLAGMAHAPAWAVYKCQDVHGRTSYQQAPCAGAMQGEKLNVPPASGARLPAASQPADTTSMAPDVAAPRRTETDRLNALSSRLAKENRLSTLNNLRISAAQSDAFQAQKRCQSEIAAARNRKARANNDVADATWAQSLSAEMQAIAAQCDTEQRRLQTILERFLAEKQDLEHELAKP